MKIEKLKKILNGTESNEEKADKLRLTELCETHKFILDKYYLTLADKQRYVYALAISECKTKAEFSYTYNLLLDILRVPKSG